MTSVERLRVLAIEPLHAARKCLRRQLDHQVNMIAHQHVRCDGPVEALHAGAEQRDEEFAVGVIAKNVLTRIAATTYVVQ